MQFETVNVSIDNGIARVLLNRPETRNSLDHQMRLDSRAAIEAVGQDDSVRVVLLGGEGKGFCAGAELGNPTPGFGEPGHTKRELNEEFEMVVKAIVECPKPVIAVTQGAIAGIGMALALASDLLVMSDDSFLYCAFGKISLIPDGGLHFLLRDALGPKKAYEMIAFSERISAHECMEKGIANHVVPADKLWSTAEAAAAELSKSAPLSLKYSKQLLTEARDKSFAEVMELESVIQDEIIRSEDFDEGVKAFFGKTEPQFKGR